KVITFGRGSCDYTAADISYDAMGHATFTPIAFGKPAAPVSLGVPGEHNVYNALAAFALCRAMEIPSEQIVAGLSKFTGADRRFQFKGVFHGATIIDDYAHHPSEIAASIQAARKMTDKHLIVLFQPHTYTRTKAFLDDFANELAKADEVGLCKIYEAREQDIYGVSSVDILERIEKRGTECRYFPTFAEAQRYYAKKLSENDLLITMGAGNVVTVGEELLKEK
ncbi:MAG: UDP-N-acetylmuramate--L-alanine ligase, partial [Lachnospiraceae bacterium]|nr:UDP-N-acetylmuramate--L-alanine ligase [Lachnospiraceae bacterium]